MADELTPITRLEGILAGQDIQPITRLEYFLKQYAGGGGSGGGAGAFVVNATLSGSTVTCDKTAAEMLSAFQSGIVIVFINIDGEKNYCSLVAVESTLNRYVFTTDLGEEKIRFVADSDDAYPSFAN